MIRLRSASEENPPKTTVCGAPKPGAGQHGHHGLGNHRHVDGDLVAGPDADFGQAVGGLADRGQQVGVGDGAGVARLTLPMEGDPIAEAGLHMAVDAVDSHVQPARPRTTWRRAAANRATSVHGVVPLQVLGLRRPERLGVGRRLFINARLGIGAGRQRGRWREGAGFMQKG